MFKKKKFEREAIDADARDREAAQEARRRDTLERFPWLAHPATQNEYGVTRDGFGLGLRNGLVQLPEKPPVVEDPIPLESLEVLPADPLPVLPGSLPPGLSPPYPPSLHPHLSSPPDPPGELKLEESKKEEETEERQEVRRSSGETKEALGVKEMEKDTKQAVFERTDIQPTEQTPEEPGTDNQTQSSEPDMVVFKTRSLGPSIIIHDQVQPRLKPSQKKKPKTTVKTTKSKPGTVQPEEEPTTTEPDPV